MIVDNIAEENVAFESPLTSTPQCRFAEMADKSPAGSLERPAGRRPLSPILVTKRALTEQNCKFLQP